MLAKKKILVVDDDIDVLSLVETILENEGYEVLTAVDCKSGLDLARSARPAVALVDVIMEGPYDGFKLAEILVKDPDFKDTRVIIHTSLRIFEANTDELLNMAKFYRQEMEGREMDVIMVMDYTSGKVGIDYRDTSGNICLLEVDGMIRKPVIAISLIEGIASAIEKSTLREAEKSTGLYSQ